MGPPNNVTLVIVPAELKNLRLTTAINLNIVTEINVICSDSFVLSAFCMAKRESHLAN